MNRITPAIVAVTLALSPVAASAAAAVPAPPTSVATAVSTATVGQANALSRAKQYLEVMPFSKKGLYRQLRSEG